MHQSQHVELFTADDSCWVIIENIAAVHLTREEKKELERRLREKCQTKLGVNITLAPFSQGIAGTEALVFHCPGLMSLNLPEALHLEPVIDSTVGANLMETIWETLAKALRIVDVTETALITGCRMIAAVVTEEKQEITTRPFEPQSSHVN